MTDHDDVLGALADLPMLAKPVVSPDGRRVALYHDGSGRNEVCVLDIETGALRQWSDGEAPANVTTSFVAWAPDGERVLFHRDDAGDEEYDICALDAAGTVEPLVAEEGKALVVDVTDDSFLFRSPHGGGMDLYRYRVEDGRTTRLTDTADPVWRAAAGGGRVAYQADGDDGSVVVTDADGTDPRTLPVGAGDADAKPVDWSADGRRLLLAADDGGYWRAGVYDVDADEVQWYGDGGVDETPVSFLPDERRFVVEREAGTTTDPVVYDAGSGAGRELAVPDGVAVFGLLYDPGRVTDADGRLVFLHTTPTRRASLLAYDLASDDWTPLLAADYGPFDRADFADVEAVRFASDGVPETPAAAVDHDPYEQLEIGGLLYDPGERPAPLVVNPHGGPRLRDQRSFDLGAQALAARGYAVLQVNYRGSTGRGKAFAERLHGDWGGAEQGDVATGVEHVLATRDWVDGDRVAVYGGSFGGYSAYWQLVQYPDLYDAGVAAVGYTDLAAAHGEMPPQFQGFMETYLGSPDENPDLYAERSPVTHAENLAAPLLMLHGVNDPRVPVSQARRFRDRLAELGYEQGEAGDFEYHEFDGGHGSTDADHRRRRFRLLGDFLDRRL